MDCSRLIDGKESSAAVSLAYSNVSRHFESSPEGNDKHIFFFNFLYLNCLCSYLKETLLKLLNMKFVLKSIDAFTRFGAPNPEARICVAQLLEWWTTAQVTRVQSPSTKIFSSLIVLRFMILYLN